MNKYFLITSSKYDGIIIDETNTKKQCEMKLVEREKGEYKLFKIIKGIDLTAVPKEVVIEYEIDEYHRR